MAHYHKLHFKLQRKIYKKCEISSFWLNEPALKMLVLQCNIFDIGPFGSQRCYLRTRILPEVPARWSKRCYFGEGNCYFQAQKGAISGQTFAGASRGLSDVRNSTSCGCLIACSPKQRARCLALPISIPRSTRSWSRS
jgi:hypothetical protein